MKLIKYSVSAALSFFKKHNHVNWTLLDQVLVSGVNFSTGILIARFLGLHEFGVFTLAWMAVLFVSSLQNALIVSPMMSIGPKQTANEAPAYYGALMTQQLIIGLASFLLLFTGAWGSQYVFPQWGASHIALPLACAAMSYQIQDFMRRYFFTISRPPVAFLNDFISYIGQLLLLLWLFDTDCANSANVLFVIAGTSLCAIIVALVQMESVSRPQISIFTKICRRHWNFSKWLTASALMQWTSGNLFVITAGATLGPWATGALKAAQNIIGITHILFQGLNNIAPVKAGRMFHANGLIPMESYLRKVMLYSSVPMGMALLAAIIFPDFLLKLVYGDDYAVYGWILSWYSIIYIVMFLALPINYGLRAMEETKPFFTAYFYTTILSLILAYPIINKFGLPGVMVGLFILALINFLVTSKAYWKKRIEFKKL